MIERRTAPNCLNEHKKLAAMTFVASFVCLNKECIHLNYRWEIRSPTMLIDVQCPMCRVSGHLQEIKGNIISIDWDFLNWLTSSHLRRIHNKLYQLNFSYDLNRNADFFCRQLWYDEGLLNDMSLSLCVSNLNPIVE